MRILNAEPENYSRKAYGVLASLGEVIECHCDRSQLLELVPEIDVLIVRLGHHIDEEVFSKATSLKVVVTATTGLNHIDLKAADQYDVAVLSLKGERQFLDTLTATAELAWAGLLAFVRNIPGAVDHVNEGGWNRDLFKGYQLKGKTLGIVGYGRLGSIVAAYGKAFQMKVIFTDPFVDAYPREVEKVEFPYLLANSDVVSVHVNYDQSTHGLFDRQAFLQFKKGSILINTSRGELIDELAMLDALENNILKGVVLDVLSDEANNSPIWPKDNVVWQKISSNSNILITPHIGGATHESMASAEQFMADKLRLFTENEMNI
ncbi:MAG: NAD(P)-dependent oxidoreductase [Cellvibrionaceae bacterium]